MKDELGNELKNALGLGTDYPRGPVEDRSLFFTFSQVAFFNISKVMVIKLGLIPAAILSEFIKIRSIYFERMKEEPTDTSKFLFNSRCLESISICTGLGKEMVTSVMRTFEKRGVLCNFGEDEDGTWYIINESVLASIIEN